jgi:hypothetical protein
MAKRDIKKILTGKGLTGREAAALIIRNFVETDHHRPAILTEAEIQQLRTRVRKLTEQDVEDFNSYMDLYRIVGYTLKEAEVLYLRIGWRLSALKDQLLPFITQHYIGLVAQSIPYCVTEKQLQDLREQRLQRLHCMAEVIDARAGNLSEGRWWSTESSEEEDAAILEEATRQIARALEEHDLEPVRLEECADETEREDIERCPFDLGEPENLHLYLSGEQLYQTGLPEWQPSAWQIVEPARTRWSPEVAVVQDPLKSNLDDRGWYTEEWIERLSILPELDARDDEEAADIRQTLERTHTLIRKMLRLFLAHQPIFEALSELVGVKLHEDLEEWLAEIKEEVAIYRNTLELGVLQPLPENVAERLKKSRPDLPPFTIEDLKPDRRHVQHLKERMAIALTAEEQFEAFSQWLRERCEEIDETEDSLAEEVSGHED